jgi:hypothetical protein
MDTFNETNFLFNLSVQDQLLFKVLKLWIVLVEYFQVIIDLSLPKPVVFFEITKELLYVVLGTLNGTGKKQNDLNNFFVFGNPVIEWLSLVFWLIFLVPVLHILCRLQNVTCSLIDCTLYFIKGWFECAVVTLEGNVYLEEWLQDLLWHVSSSTNSLFHLVQRVFGSMEKSLIH